MKLINDSGVFYLEEKGTRAALTSQEVSLLRRMSPFGRKVILRKRALESKTANPDDAEANLILELVKLPIYEWSFLIPN